MDFSNPDGCWLWNGSMRHYYGEVWRDGRRLYAHRVGYELIYGELPPGLNVLHRCDTPRCVRPDHLFTGTQADNCKDMGNKGRWRNQSAAGANAGSPWRAAP